MKPFAIVAPFALLTLTACQSGETESAAESGEPAAAAAEDSGPLGTYTGTLDQAGTSVEGHTVEVLDYANGQPQIGIFDFCNIDLVGEGPTYTAADGASCLVDLGDGRKPHDASAEVTFEGGTVEATVTFAPGDVVWTYTGTAQ